MDEECARAHEVTAQPNPFDSDAEQLVHGMLHSLKLQTLCGLSAIGMKHVPGGRVTCTLCRESVADHPEALPERFVCVR